MQKEKKEKGDGVLAHGSICSLGFRFWFKYILKILKNSDKKI
jgi:hypothetical protein